MRSVQKMTLDTKVQQPYSDPHASEEAMDIAEDSRQESWEAPSVVAELFQGRFRWDLMRTYPEQSPEDKKIGDAFIQKVKTCLETHLDPEQVDAKGVYPKAALKALAAIGAFGMKIPKEYGGLELSIVNYIRVISYISTYCGSTAVWLSAHQSIGVPEPLKAFGTSHQKKKYLSRLAKGAISAFALTEPEVGSDPARMTSRATLSKGGKYYTLNGIKQWCTNGPEADILIVMALTKEKIIRGKKRKQISAFIVERSMKGFEVESTCTFMGLHGISNGVLRFKDVRVPVENRLGDEGDGLRIALKTLNAGRLAVPGCSAAAGKWCLAVNRFWANERVQWGMPIGMHEDVSYKLVDVVTKTYAMDSLAMWAAHMAERDDVDIRIEAAAAKYYGSEEAWHVIDHTLQIRGGRGYETALSLRERGEVPLPVERLMRDLRINRIIEGTSGIMRLFIAREAVDVHFQMAKPFLSRHSTLGQKLRALRRMSRFYSTWYVKQWFCLPIFPRTSHLDRRHIQHLYFIKRSAKRLARSLFHAMIRYRASFDKKQLILGTYVDIGVELFVMACVLSRTEHTLQSKAFSSLSDQKQLLRLSNYFCTSSRRQIKQMFGAISYHKDAHAQMHNVSHSFLRGAYKWLEGDIYNPLSPSKKKALQKNTPKNTQKKNAKSASKRKRTSSLRS